MRVFELGRFRKARVWLDELPDATYPVSRSLTSSVAASPAPGIERLGAVELLTPLGGMIRNALLGGCFSPMPSEFVMLSVNLSANYEVRFRDSLATGVDDVFVGLPVEYGNAVIAGLEEGLQTSPLPGGQFVVNSAAHGMVGSSPVAFKSVATALVRLFAIRQVEPSDSDLRAIFD